MTRRNRPDHPWYSGVPRAVRYGRSLGAAAEMQSGEHAIHLENSEVIRELSVAIPVIGVEYQNSRRTEDA